MRPRAAIDHRSGAPWRQAPSRLRRESNNGAGDRAGPSQAVVAVVRFGQHRVRRSSSAALLVVAGPICLCAQHARSAQQMKPTHHPARRGPTGRPAGQARAGPTYAKPAKRPSRRTARPRSKPPAFFEFISMPPFWSRTARARRGRARPGRCVGPRWRSRSCRCSRRRAWD